MRVAILGNSGSGKSALAAALAAETGREPVVPLVLVTEYYTRSGPMSLVAHVECFES